MSVRMMTARYPGTCRTCGQPIARGSEIGYAGRGLVYHAGPCTAERDETAVPFHTASNRRYRTTTYDTPQGIARRTEYIRDPGEDAADRWNETYA